MTTETVLTSSDWDPESPITTTLAGAWSQNWIAFAEGNSATKLQGSAIDSAQITHDKLAEYSAGDTYEQYSDSAEVLNTGSIATWAKRSGIVCSVGGTLRVSIQYSRYPDGSGNVGGWRVKKNGSVVYTNTTSSTTYASDSTDVSVSAMDVVTVEYYGTHTKTINVVFSSDTDTIKPVDISGVSGDISSY